MNIKTARALLQEPIESISLKILQRHKVRLLDAWRESTADYGFAQAVKDGFYKIVESDSASGFVPADPWLSHNLDYQYQRVVMMEEKELFGESLTPEEFVESLAE